MERSWNVNGIRAIAKKTFFTDLELIGPDILAFILDDLTGSDHCPVGIVLNL